MKLSKYLLSLALVCACMFSVSYAQSKKITKPQPKRGIINDTLIFVKKPVRTPSRTATTRKTAKDGVRPVKGKTNTKRKAASKSKKAAIKP